MSLGSGILSSMPFLKRLRIFMFIASVFCLSVLACGYKIQRPGITSIRVGVIKNNSTEPGLQDILYDMLAPELHKRGILINSQSPYVLEGTIEEIKYSTVSIRDGIEDTYDIVIEGNFIMKGPDDRKKSLLKSDFIITASSRGPLVNVTASKEVALRKAIRNLASSLASSASYLTW